MSGNVRGIIDCRLPNQVNSSSCRDVFKRVFDYFNTHPNMTRIALRRRNGVAGASNLGYWDAGATSWADGNTALGSWDRMFGVFRVNASASRTWPYYVLVGISESVSGSLYFHDGASPATNVGAVYIMTAVGIGGDLNPWNGTTNNDGTDAYPTPVWKIPSGGTAVSVLPASNNGVYTHATNKNNGTCIFGPFNTGSTPSGNNRFSIVGDDDSFVFFYDGSDVGTINAVALVTPYTPRAGITASAPLLVYRAVTGAPADGTTVGNTNGTNNANYNGGIVAPDSLIALASPRQGLLYTPMLPSGVLSNAGQPNYVTSKRELWPMLFRSFGNGVGDDANAGGGFIGHVPASTFGLTNGVNVYDLSADKKTIFVGDSSPLNVQVGIPFWDGVTTPRSTLTRDGVAFSRAP
jgi:hypothetical protein